MNDRLRQDIRFGRTNRDQAAQAPMSLDQVLEHCGLLRVAAVVSVDDRHPLHARIARGHVLLDRLEPGVHDRVSRSARDDHVLTLAANLGGERVGERLSVGGDPRLVDPDAVASGNAALEGERRDPGRLRLRQNGL